MREIRLTLRCATDPDHAKILRIKDKGWPWVDELAMLLTGVSDLYIYKPGPGSPIGKCAICGARLSSKIETLDSREGDDDAHDEGQPDNTGAGEVPAGAKRRRGRPRKIQPPVEPVPDPSAPAPAPFN